MEEPLGLDVYVYTVLIVPPIAVYLEPFRTAVPFVGTQQSNYTLFVPKTGLQS